MNLSAGPVDASSPVPVLEIGGTHVTAALVDMEAGRVISSTAVTNPLRSDVTSPEIVASIAHTARAVDAHHHGAVWGVAIPGPFDYSMGIGRFQGVAKFEALNGFDLRRALLDKLDDAAGMVFLNDAEAFVVGEWMSGAAKGHSRVVGITLGTGVGSAFLADGRVVDRGREVPPEGRVDLLEIAGRPLEDTMSRRAIRSTYAGLTGQPINPDVDVDVIASRAREGESAAIEVITESVSALGYALGPWLASFGAQSVVVGGSIARSWDIIQLPFIDGIRRWDGGLPARVEVKPALLPAEAALIGAARHALAPAAGQGRDDPVKREGVKRIRDEGNGR